MNEYSPDEPVDDVDLTVVGALARLLDTLDPPPDGMVERTLFALTLEGLHAEVMQLQHHRAPELSVRGERPEQARTITFTASAVTAMITLSAGAARGVRVDGWTAPAGRFAVELHQPGGVLRTETDEHGRFVLEDVDPGPASLVLRGADGGPAVSTPVVEL